MTLRCCMTSLKPWRGSPARMHPSGAPVTKSHSSVPSGGTGVLRPPLPPAPTMLLCQAADLGGGGLHLGTAEQSGSWPPLLRALHRRPPPPQPTAPTRTPIGRWWAGIVAFLQRPPHERERTAPTASQQSSRPARTPAADTKHKYDNNGAVPKTKKKKDDLRRAPADE